MKKIIKAGLLSTVGLCNLISGANPVDATNDEAIMGAVVSGVAEGTVLEVGDHQRAQGLRMINDMKAGILPNEILNLFAGIPKIDVAQSDSPKVRQAMFTNMRNELSVRLDDEGIRYLNVVLRSSVSSPGHLYFGVVPPLAQKFFGEMHEAITAETFFTHLTHAYGTLFIDPNRAISEGIETPVDWAMVQFLGLFFDNAINALRFNVNAAELGNYELVIKIVTALHKAATLNVLNIGEFYQEFQVKILSSIAELRPKNVHILNGIAKVADLMDLVYASTDQSLQTFSEGSKVDNVIVLDFKHRELSERVSALVSAFESFSDLSVPRIWDLVLNLKNFENIAYGALTPLMRSIVRAPIGRNLALPMLVSDQVRTTHVMTKLREEFLSPESKVQVLNFEGSQLTAEGWEQLAQLAESKKTLEKIRLTGLQIPRSIAPRLGMLRSVGINMAGCNVNATDLIDMVAGWLGEGSILKGVDLRGNAVNVEIATMFLEKGFTGYGDERTGFIFGKS